MGMGMPSSIMQMKTDPITAPCAAAIWQQKPWAQRELDSANKIAPQATGGHTAGKR
jgi:hypothetical protein